MGGMTGNIVGYVVMVFAAPAIFGALRWFCKHSDEVRAIGRRVAHRPPVLVPDGRPVGQIAADLRRLGSCARAARGTTFARQRGLEMAYDDVLVQASRALAIPQNILDLPPGVSRDVERLRIEAALEDAGLALRAR
ncbi:MAG: hypothetical protein ACR2JQ_05280 [Mycobacteriales bacterium]